jgi:hypothetical protein
VAIANGVDQETDAALRVRFQKYISSLGKASNNAVGAAVLSVQSGLTYVINEGQNVVGGTLAGNMAIIVDDGSGAIPAGTLTSVGSAVDLVRAAGITRNVTAPTNVAISVAIVGSTFYPSFTTASVKSALQAAIVAWVNANGVGGANASNGYVPSNTLTYAGLLGVIAGFIGTGAGQGLIGYSSVTLNGGASNVVLTGFQLARTSAASVTIN